MTEEKPFSIFNSSAYAKPKKDSSGVKKEEAQPSQTPPPSKKIEDSSTKTEIDAMMNKIRQMHDDIERKLDDVYQKTGMDPKKIKTLLDNPNNFNPRQWEAVQEQRKNYASQISPPGVEGAESPSQESTENLTVKERKSKTIGSRRKWIPMR